MIKRLTLLISSALILSTVVTQAATDRKIEANMSKLKTYNKEAIFNCIGAGRAGEGLRGSWQRQLAQVQEDMPFKFIRFHGIFHDDMGVYKDGNNGKGIYNFQYVDELYDYLLSVGIKPFVELSFMPEAMASGDMTVFWWKGNVTPPADYNKWEELITKFTQHLTDRYGADEVRTWYFEVWNEPNHKSFFSSDMAEYFKMYEYAARAVKSVDESYRVGGPASAGNQWVMQIIEHCAENNLPLDFIATHNYGVRGALDEFGVKQLRLIDDSQYVANAFNDMRQKMDKAGRSDLELHYTEWSSSYSPRDLTHDTYLNAAYVLNQLRRTNDNIQSMSYWTFTDIFEESGVPTEPLHGGFGLMTMNGLKKPTYFSYLYLNQLGDREANSNDENSWVCIDDMGNIQILAYDITMPTYKEGEVNKTYFGKEQIAKSKGELKVNLSNVANGKYCVEIFKTGHRQNDIQTIYFEMGKPQIISHNQYEILSKHSQNAPIKVDFIDIDNNTYDIALPLNENDIYLIKLTLMR